MLRVLAIGDVVGQAGCEILAEKLPALKREQKIDLVIVNGENSAEGNGITPHSAEQLFACGAQIITTGNHAFKRREIYELFDREDYFIRPYNYGNGAPGKGVCFYDFLSYRVCVINLSGTVYMDNLENPFSCIDRILKEVSPKDIVLLDFHAEATSEKRAMGFYLDGRITAMWGTHTHVQTADEQILPGGTGYITDLGMTGPLISVIGVRPELAIERLKTHLPVRFKNAGHPSGISGILLEIDEKTQKTTQIIRLNIH